MTKLAVAAIEVTVLRRIFTTRPAAQTGQNQQDDCAKKRQMTLTLKGVPLLVQVRVAVLNAELKLRKIPDRSAPGARQKLDHHPRLAA